MLLVLGVKRLILVKPNKRALVPSYSSDDQYWQIEPIFERDVPERLPAAGRNTAPAASITVQSVLLYLLEPQPLAVPLM